MFELLTELASILDLQKMIEPDDLEFVSEDKIRNMPEFSGLLDEYHAMMRRGATPAIGYSKKQRIFVVRDIGKV